MFGCSNKVGLTLPDIGSNDVGTTLKKIGTTLGQCRSE